MAYNCSGPYAAYFRTDIADASVAGLSAAMGIELVLSSVSSANGQAHGMTIDIACPTGSSPGAGYHSFIKLETWGNATAMGHFDDYFNLFYINGPAAGAGNLIGAGNSTLRVNLNGTSRYIPTSSAEGSFTFAYPVVLTYNGTLLDVDSTTAASSGNVNCIDIDYTNSSSGIVNMRAMEVDLTMAASCSGPYAGYFRVDCVGQQVLGLGAALGVEVCLPGTTITSGQFHGITIDFECAAGGDGFGNGSGQHSFIKFETWGDATAKNNFDDGWNLFYINGPAAGTGSMFATDPNDKADGKVNATLRINVNGTSYWIPLWDAANGA